MFDHPCVAILLARLLYSVSILNGISKIRQEINYKNLDFGVEFVNASIDSWQDKMIIDAWSQHPMLRHIQDPMFDSLRRWSKNTIPTEPIPAGHSSSPGA
jgi:hypothetical protein